MSHVRGDKARAIIENGIRKLAEEAKGKYIYNIVELSKETGVSRPTLYRHEEFIDSVLKKISAEKKEAKGHGVIEFMRGKMERQENVIQELQLELDTLRLHHAEIYETLFYQSARIASLIKPVVIQEIKALGRCTLCQQEVKGSTLLPNVHKVVSLVPPPRKG